MYIVKLLCYDKLLINFGAKLLKKNVKGVIEKTKQS